MEYFPLFIQFDTACRKHRCIGFSFVEIFIEPTGFILLLQHNIFVLATYLNWSKGLQDTNVLLIHSFNLICCRHNTAVKNRRQLHPGMLVGLRRI